MMDEYLFDPGIGISSKQSFYFNFSDFPFIESIVVCNSVRRLAKGSWIYIPERPSIRADRMKDRTPNALFALWRKLCKRFQELPHLTYGAKFGTRSSAGQVAPIRR
jgi:hypothetical protein